MLIKYFLLILLAFTIILGILNGVWLHMKKENDIIGILVEFIKIILPIFALISLFLPLDYNSFWFIVYVSIYYILEAVYNLIGKILLKDIQGKKFKPNLLEQKTKYIISSFVIIYILSFHLLLHNTIIYWISNSLFTNIISIIGLVLLSLLSFMGSLLVLYDFYTIIEFPIFNKIINKMVKNINTITYKKLYKKLKFIDRFFVFVFKPEIETQINIKNIILTLNTKYTQEQLNNKLSEKDKQFIVESLSNFQDSYIK